MPCSRRSAIRRLLNLYIERLSTDSDYASRASISDVISEENVQTVSVLNLYSDYDHPPLAIQDHDRDMRLLTAWLSPSMGRVS